MASSTRFGGTCSQPPPLPRPLTAKRLLARVFWSQRWYMAASGSLGIFSMILQASVPAAAGYAIDRGIRTGDRTALMLWIGVCFGLNVVLAVVWVIRHRFALGVHIRTNAWMERTIASRILHTGGGLEGRRTSGELVALGAIDARRVAYAMDIFGRGIGSVVIFIAVMTAMFFANSNLALVVLALLAPMLLFTLWRLRALESRTALQQHQLGAASSVAADAIAGIRVVKGVGGESQAMRRYDTYTSRILDAAVRVADVRSHTLAIDVMMPIAVVSVVGWYGGQLVVDGTLEVGQLVTISGWSVFLFAPLLTFGEMGRKLAIGLAAAGRIVNMIQIPPATSTSGNSVAPEGSGVLELHAVATTDGVLRDFDFTPQPGAFTAVVADGATRRTVSDVIARTVDVASGSVCVGGLDIREWDLEAYRSTVLVAEHDATLFEGSLRHNLCVGKIDADDKELTHALVVAAGEDILDLLDGGLDGPVLERGRSLSGGQRQRVALARALLANSEILVLIDPTSALDAYTESEIAERLPHFRRGRTTVVFTSSPALLSVADHVITFDASLEEVS